jgi:hypothetical protein
MQKQLLSVLTSPPRPRYQRVIKVLRHPHSLFKVLERAAGRKGPSRFGGPSAVMRSLIGGLDKTGTPYNYNPKKAHLGSTCIVLSGLDTLQSALRLKRSGIIRRLCAGPNIVTLPNEAKGMLATLEIDACIVPSGWVRDVYADYCASLAGRIIVWAAGVNTEYWNPSHCKRLGRNQSPRILVYVKGARGLGGGDPFIPRIERSGYHVRRIEYGHYSREDYKALLGWADLMIVLGDTESQGIAMAEAWSMNVPTLVRQAPSWVAPDGRSHPASASPYLSEHTGAFFWNEHELLSLMQEWQADSFRFSPRSWVIKNMSDEICAENLLRLINHRKE